MRTGVTARLERLTARFRSPGGSQPELWNLHRNPGLLASILQGAESISCRRMAALSRCTAS